MPTNVLNRELDRTLTHTKVISQQIGGNSIGMPPGYINAQNFVIKIEHPKFPGSYEKSKLEIARKLLENADKDNRIPHI